MFICKLWLRYSRERALQLAVFKNESKTFNHFCGFTLGILALLQIKMLALLEMIFSDFLGNFRIARHADCMSALALISSVLFCLRLENAGVIGDIHADELTPRRGGALIFQCT